MFAYCFKVALAYDKRTYRNIEILENQSLHDLHHAIYDAFDRYEEHLYSFFLTLKATKSTRVIYDSPEYTHPTALEGDSLFGYKEKHNAEKTNIADLDLTEKDKLYYLFDFGDEWWHELRLLKTTNSDKRQRYPRIVKKVGDSPEQYPDYEEGWEEDWEEDDEE